MGKMDIQARMKNLQQFEGNSSIIHEFEEAYFLAHQQIDQHFSPFLSLVYQTQNLTGLILGPTCINLDQFFLTDKVLLEQRVKASVARSFYT